MKMDTVDLRARPLRRRRVSSRLALAIALLGSAHAAQSLSSEATRGMEKPQTVAESSGWVRTSLHADVDAFWTKLQNLPHARRLRRSVFGKSAEGRALWLVTAAKEELPEDVAEAREAVRKGGKLRLLVNANIHAGEVEGKEAVQILMREIAHGAHADLLDRAVLLFVPIYNADGNERIDKKHRVSQNGPSGGVGSRHTSQDFDLNRDFVKVDTPECRAMHGLIRDWDPDLFMDLHTTNGSAHGYELTYAPSLAVNVDPALRAFTRKVFLPEVRAAMRRNHRFEVFDYGNFIRRDPAKGWATYDHRPRFGTNYFALRNRLAILSEAYSYETFPVRTAVTRAFVLEVLRAVVRHEDELREISKAADAQCRAGRQREAPLAFGFASRLEDPVTDEVLVGELERKRIEGLGVRYISKPGGDPRKIPTQLAFVAEKKIDAPAAWVVAQPSKRLLDLLRVHGIEHRRLDEAIERDVEVFTITRARKRRRVFQKHYERSLEGSWRREKRSLPARSLWVPARQRLYRVAAQLLEAQSEDSLVTWNVFDQELESAMAEDARQEFPILRVPGAR